MSDEDARRPAIADVVTVWLEDLGAPYRRSDTDLGHGLLEISIEDPTGHGAPLHIIAEPGGGTVMQLPGGVRAEVSDTEQGLERLGELLAAVLTGSLVAKATRRASVVSLFDAEGRLVSRLKTRWGLFGGTPTFVGQLEYGPYGSS